MNPAPALTAVVDIDVPGPTISRHLYGHFAEHLGRCIYDGFWVGEDSEIENIGGIRADVVEALRSIAIPNLRWPGGCFADEYHWTDGVGPRDERPRMVNTHWGDVEENNHFGTHEFMALCELLDAEPYISGNVGSGTVKETSDWVEYLTRAGDSPMARRRAENGRREPWSVKFFGVGNEPWGCGGNLTAQQFSTLARQHATYARNHGENSLYRIAAGGSEDDYVWTEVLMKQLTRGLQDPSPSDLYQAISFHCYTMSGSWMDKGSATEFSEEEYWTTLARAERVGEILAGHVAVMDAYDPAKKVGLVLDEWGTWWNVEPGTNPGFLHQQNTLRDALVAAVHFDAFHAHADRLRLANIAQTVNVLQSMLLTDGRRLILTPTYHVFAMSVGHHDARRLPVNPVRAGAVHEADGREVSTVKVSASTKDGTVTITAANLDPTSSAVIELHLRGGDGGVITGAQVLTSADPRDHNTAEDLDRVAPVPFEGAVWDGGLLRLDLPAASFVSLQLSA
ncbi:alpha-N-arabinofuranosidase [Nesterenkonia sp. HG001]|uniref:alpha-N-arabinofuranosidase n=1 Tax=Nesterenkonia sp. HG001 TaxID=2983207 RepID=UPI002AC5C36E|nr:alpha-L-arabinofuranosidase C-terminal domain-containing protein [Nesterenkonia sp. HG001]MDZ5076006.1 alpha-N-arabinofuranosidase [Nesterenkonia sp. HG001]